MNHASILEELKIGLVVSEVFMATLNVKNLPDDIYDKLRARAQREHRSISQEVIHIISVTLAAEGQLSISQLKGLGREYWSEIEATEHVEEERQAWD